MTNESKHTSQDYDRKHNKNHIEQNPRAVKDSPKQKDSKVNDMRNLAREEHTNHFTNRAPAGKA